MPAQEKPYRVYGAAGPRGGSRCTRPRRRTAGRPAGAADARARRAPSGAGRAAGSRSRLVLSARPRSSSGRRRATSPSRAASRRRTTACRRASRRQLTKRRRAARLDADDDPPARHRRRRPQPGAAGRQPLRLDHAAPHRPRQAPARLPLDPARPAGRDPRLRRRRRSTRRTSSAARRSRCGRSKDLTGLDVNHVAFVDFDRFKELIDAVGGIDIDVPAADPARTGSTARTRPRRAARLGGLALRERDAAHGRAARARLLADPREPARTRARPTSTARERQQQVIQATLDKVTSVGTALKLPFIGGDLVQAARDRPQRRAADAARLGRSSGPTRRARSTAGSAASPATVGGESVILGSEDNVATIAMFTGRSAPLPPPRGPALRARLRRRRPQARERGSVGAARPASVASSSVSFVGSFFSPSRPSSLEPPTRRPSPRLARAAAVVGRVEAGALEVHRDREQHLLDGARAADLALSAGASLIRWKTSKVCPFGQRYS